MTSRKIQNKNCKTEASIFSHHPNTVGTGCCIHFVEIERRPPTTIHRRGLL